MMHPAITELVRAFPQLAAWQAGENSGDHDAQWNEFAGLIAGLYQGKDYHRVQYAFDRLEDILADGPADLRSWVAGVLHALQEVTSWSCSGNSDIFRGFLGPDARRVWETLDTIRFDLASCSILEAEILMWRVVHHGDLRAVSDTGRLA